MIFTNMSSTLLVFKDVYDKYNEGALIVEKELAIAGYESVFLVNLVAFYYSRLAQISLILVSAMEFSQ